jgi:hypothetical protein
VIEKDHPQSHAAEEIKPEVALHGMRESWHFFSGHLPYPLSRVMLVLGDAKNFGDAKNRETMPEDPQKEPAAPNDRRVDNSQPINSKKPSDRITSSAD